MEPYCQSPSKVPWRFVGYAHYVLQMEDEQYRTYVTAAQAVERDCLLWRASNVAPVPQTE
jgi:hypothetical protein